MAIVNQEKWNRYVEKMGIIRDIFIIGFCITAGVAISNPNGLRIFIVHDCSHSTMKEYRMTVDGDGVVTMASDTMLTGGTIQGCNAR